MPAIGGSDSPTRSLGTDGADGTLLPAPDALPALPDGVHRVRFPDGSQYIGEYHGGRMHGRGVFIWPTGACSEVPGWRGSRGGLR